MDTRELMNSYLRQMQQNNEQERLNPPDLSYQHTVVDKTVPHDIAIPDYLSNLMKYPETFGIAPAAINPYGMGGLKSQAQLETEKNFKIATEGPKLKLLQPAARMYDTVTSAFPDVKPGGWREKGSVPNSDHPKGLALDIPVPLKSAKGDTVANFLIDQPGVKYVIWNDKIWENGKWKPYKHPAGSNPTLNHEDHVHVSMKTEIPAKTQVQQALTGGGRMGANVSDPGQAPEVQTANPIVKQRGQYLVADYHQLTQDPYERWLIDHESDGYLNKKNPKSTATQLGQLTLENRESYGKRLGIDPNTLDPNEQLSLMREYIKDRYGTSQKAVAFWKTHNWY